jgi:P-type E1-E2 ATPase
LAVILGIVGLLVAIFVVIFLIVVLVVYRLATETAWRLFDAVRILYIISLGLAILIMAIPEGLPLVVTLAIAFAVIKMAKDCIVVRNLHAVEDVGNISVLFVDKTGLLTLNRMSVTGMYIQVNFVEKSTIKFRYSS